MTAEERYSALVATFIEQPGATKQGKGLGAAALKANGSWFLAGRGPSALVGGTALEANLGHGTLPRLDSH